MNVNINYKDNSAKEVSVTEWKQYVSLLSSTNLSISEADKAKDLTTKAAWFTAQLTINEVKPS